MLGSARGGVRRLGLRAIRWSLDAMFSNETASPGRDFASVRGREKAVQSRISLDNLR